MAQDPDEFEQELNATFRGEAQEHLLRLEARLLSLEQEGSGAGTDLANRILSELHTLKGAARVAGRQALAQLCHAFENVVSASGFATASFERTQFDALHDAVKTARKLVLGQDGRTLNQARASVGRLDALAIELAASGPSTQPAAATAAPSTAPAALAAPAPAPTLSKPAATRTNEPRPEIQAHTAIRVPTRHIDLIRQHTEELLQVELDLQHAVSQLDAADGMNSSAEQLQQHCRRVARDMDRLRHRFSLLRNGLLDSALETSMEPFSAVFEQMPGLVRGLARAAGKEVSLKLRGEETCVDRRILEPVRDMLIQLLTNAVDHGIEAPQERVRQGKPQAGTISISVDTRGADSVALTVQDDGAGIDREAVAAAAHAYLPAEEVAELNQGQVAQLIFRPGLSTASTLTATSGRGVGLALVADKLAAIGGEAELESQPDQGCSFRLTLPVRLARMLGLAVRVRQQRFVLPLATLKAVISLSAEQQHMVSNLGTLRWQDKVLPTISVARALGVDHLQPARGNGDSEQHAVIARGANGPYALLVDEILEEQEVLLKNLGKQLRRVPYLSGATQLGDGALVPILALDDLARFHQAARSGLVEAPAAAKGPPRLLVAEDSPTTRLLLKHILETAGYAVETAPDGLEAWARLRGGRFDALISDVNMPGLDGFGLCEKVRDHGPTAQLPVVLVTSLQSPSEKERGLHAGADAYLSKGAFDQDALLAALRRLIGTETP